MRRPTLVKRIIQVAASTSMVLSMMPAMAFAVPTLSGEGLQDDLQSYDSATDVWTDNDGNIDVNYDTVGGVWKETETITHNNGTYLITLPKLISYEEMNAGIVNTADSYTVNIKGVLHSGKQVSLLAEDGKKLSYNGDDAITEETVRGKVVWTADEVFGTEDVNGCLSGTDATDTIKLTGMVSGSGEYIGYVQYTASCEDGNRMLNATPEYTGSETVMFRSAASFASFNQVLMDGVTVDPTNYVATEGSTIITFKDDYIQSLPVGYHLVTIDNGSEGTVSASLHIIGAPTLPEVPNKVLPTDEQAADLAAVYAEAYEAATHKGIIYDDGFYDKETGAYSQWRETDAIWWIDDISNKLNIAPSNGKFALIEDPGYKEYYYNDGSTPWNSYRSTIESVYVAPGIKVTDNIAYMFSGLTAATSIDITNLDTSQATSMQGLFLTDSNVSTLNVSGLDTKNVTTFQSMFNSCSALNEIDVSNFNTSNVTNMKNMFYSCQALNNITGLNTFVTKNVTDMSYMFYDNKLLESLPITNWNTSEVTNMSSMFYACTNLQLDCLSWDVSKATEHNSFNDGALGVTYPSFPPKMCADCGIRSAIYGTYCDSCYYKHNSPGGYPGGGYPGSGYPGTGSGGTSGSGTYTICPTCKTRYDYSQTMSNCPMCNWQCSECGYYYPKGNGDQYTAYTAHATAHQTCSTCGATTYYSTCKNASRTKYCSYCKASYNAHDPAAVCSTCDGTQVRCALCDLAYSADLSDCPSCQHCLNCDTKIKAETANANSGYCDSCWNKTCNKCSSPMNFIQYRDNYGYCDKCITRGRLATCPDCLTKKAISEIVANMGKCNDCAHADE